MGAVYFDCHVADDVRRSRLYGGDLFVYSPTGHGSEFCAFAREMVERAFHLLPPESAQYELSVEKYAAVLAELKPKFIHHPESKRLIKAILTDFGCDPDRVYFDVPRLRTATSDEFLTTGIAYAFHPHRDTWYSAPPCQLNWWLPVYDYEAESSMAFHSRYWSRPVKNTSSDYNYYRWNKESRRQAASQIGKDTRKQPHALEAIEPDPQLRIVCKVGGIILFSGAQLHSTVRNTSGRTRFSIDFRTVHLDDVLNRWGAPNIDSACTGTSLRDFLRSSDLVRIPEEAAQMYDQEPPPPDAELVYTPGDVPAR
jgi:hypothetical protein